MEVREMLVSNVLSQDFLRRGERLQTVFVAQSVSPSLGWFALLMVLIRGFTVVVATDQRFILCEGGHYLRSRVGPIVSEAPRNVHTGPPRVLWHRIDTLGPRLYVSWQFFKDIRDADDRLPSYQE